VVARGWGDIPASPHLHPRLNRAIIYHDEVNTPARGSIRPPTVETHRIGQLDIGDKNATTQWDVRQAFFDDCLKGMETELVTDSHPN
jgi:hypothetical protein